MGNLKHFDNLNTARFLTFCCYRFANNLQRQETIELFIKHLQLLREKR